MIEKYSDAWEKQYQLFNLTEAEKNRASEKNYIFSYISNNLGYRLGVVVAQKSADNEAPYFGWALFSEISIIPNVIVDSFYDIPRFQKFMDTKGIACYCKDNSNSKLINTLKEFRLTGFDLDVRMFPVAYHIPSKHYRDYLINLALARSIPYTEESSKNYYCPYAPDGIKSEKAIDSRTKGSLSFGTMSNHKTDLIDERIEFKTERDFEVIVNNFGNFAFDSATCCHVRQTVRKMEYRAWKYFKRCF